MQGFPFTSQVTYDSGGQPIYDRAVDSAVLRNVLKNYYNNGVFGTNNSECFQVTAPTGEEQKVIVLPGVCLINGATAYETSSVEVPLDNGDSLPRIDTIALRLDDNTSVRAIQIVVVKGTPASTPVAPALTRSSSQWELGIANVLVPANSSAVVASRITDTRQDSSRCGYVSAIAALDVTSIFNQYQAALDEYLEIVAEALDETLAGHLQDEIDALEDAIEARDKMVINTTLTGSSWSSGIYTITNAAIDPDRLMIMNYPGVPADTNYEAEYEAYLDADIRVNTVASGTLTLKAFGDVPTSVNLPFQLIIWG